VLTATPTPDVLSERNPNLCWNLLEQHINTAADELCPLIELRVCTHTLPYINDVLVEMQRDRDNQDKKAQTSGHPDETEKNRYLMRRVASELRRARSQYHRKQAIRHNQNPRKFWYDYNQIETEHSPTIAGLRDEKMVNE
jgi:hypothetical protein